MITLTEQLLPSAAEMDAWFLMGVDAGRDRKLHRAELATARILFQYEREAEGFVGTQARLLGWPNENAKLKKGRLPSYGVTIQHTTTRIRKSLIVNACPHAGDCQRMCVLDNGHGSYPSVVRARRAKTRFLVNQPRAFAFLLGYELATVSKKHRKFLLRPNVNSDIRWDLLIPSLFHPDVIVNLTSYGYTKDPFILDTDGWVPHPAGGRGTYRIAYSWNENSEWLPVQAFIDRGGSVAMVTSRKKGRPVINLMGVPTVDADKTDEWVFQEGVIGDLSAKGKARSMIGKTGFIILRGAA